MNLKKQRPLSILLITFGFILQIYMTLVEDELGAIPLLMIAIGTVWYFIIRARIRAKHVPT